MSEPDPKTEPPEADRFEILMMGYLDGELTSDQEQELRDHLTAHPAASRELARYRKLNDIAHSVRLREPQDYEWDRFWQDLYNRMERRISWFLLLFGGILTSLATIVWLLQTGQVQAWVKIGLITLLTGFLLMFLNVLRGRRRTLPFDRFRGIER